MDMAEQADRIFYADMSRESKIKRLNDIAIDCANGMGAADENMHSMQKHNFNRCSQAGG